MADNLLDNVRTGVNAEKCRIAADIIAVKLLTVSVHDSPFYLDSCSTSVQSQSRGTQTKLHAAED